MSGPVGVDFFTHTVESLGETMSTFHQTTVVWQTDGRINGQRSCDCVLRRSANWRLSSAFSTSDIQYHRLVLSPVWRILY